VTVSRTLREHYATTYGCDAAYVQNGTTSGRRVGPELLRERFGLEPGSYLLHVGRLVPEKAADVLLKAFAGVPGDVRLVLAGGSSHTDEYAAEVQALADADPRVVMTGFVFGDELATLYSHARAFINPSLLEGLPLTLLEATSYELPVVLSSIPPHVEVVGEEGPGVHLAAPGSVAGLREALLRAQVDPQAEAAGAADLSRRVLAHYDWDLATDLVEDLYRRAVQRRRTPRRPARAPGPHRRSAEVAGPRDGGRDAQDGSEPEGPGPAVLADLSGPA
jgi:glycosyltransferase involved in cell wall biosynthesis